MNDDSLFGRQKSSTTGLEDKTQTEEGFGLDNMAAGAAAPAAILSSPKPSSVCVLSSRPVVDDFCLPKRLSSFIYFKILFFFSDETGLAV